MKTINTIVGIALCFVGAWAYGDVSRADISLQRNDRLLYSKAYAPTFEEARTLVWQEAYSKYPELLKLRETAHWSTPIGLMFKMLDESKNIHEYKERLTEIIKVLELNKH